MKEPTDTTGLTNPTKDNSRDSKDSSNSSLCADFEKDLDRWYDEGGA